MQLCSIDLHFIKFHISLVNTWFALEIVLKDVTAYCCPILLFSINFCSELLMFVCFASSIDFLLRRKIYLFGAQTLIILPKDWCYNKIVGKKGSFGTLSFLLTDCPSITPLITSLSTSFQDRFIIPQYPIIVNQQKGGCTPLHPPLPRILRILRIISVTLFAINNFILLIGLRPVIKLFIALKITVFTRSENKIGPVGPIFILFTCSL